MRYILPVLVLVVGCAASRPAPVVVAPAAVTPPAPAIDLAAEGRALMRRPMLVRSVFAPDVVWVVPPALP